MGPQVGRYRACMIRVMFFFHIAGSLAMTRAASQGSVALAQFYADTGRPPQAGRAAWVSLVSANKQVHACIDRWLLSCEQHLLRACSNFLSAGRQILCLHNRVGTTQP